MAKFQLREVRVVGIAQYLKAGTHLPRTPSPHGNANMCLLERTGSGSGSTLVPCPRKMGFSDENLSQPLAKVPNE